MSTLPFDSKTLVEETSPNPWWKAHLWFRRYYYLTKPYIFYSVRYDKYLAIPVGHYDGATWAFDPKPIEGEAPGWLIHDAVCQQEVPSWADGSPINSETASQILYDQLMVNEHEKRARIWKEVTKALGCVSTRVND